MSALNMGGKLVAKKLLQNVRRHMSKGLTTGGKRAKPVKLITSKSRVERAKSGNVNYRHSHGMGVARQSGYGVDTGQLWDSLHIDTRRLTSGRR